MSKYRESLNAEKSQQDDLITRQDGLGSPAFYDALVCYADSDIQHALDLAERLEKNYDLRLCVPDRDLLPATSFYTSLAKLITHRCQKILVVLSSATLSCQTCDFIIKFATYEGRTIVPLIVSHCQVPRLLRSVIVCDVASSKFSPYFWDRLVVSILADKDVTIVPQVGEIPAYATELCRAARSQRYAQPRGMGQCSSSDEYDSGSENDACVEALDLHRDFDIEEHFRILESKKSFMARKLIAKISSKVRCLMDKIYEDGFL